MKAQTYALAKPEIVTYPLMLRQVQNQICSHVQMGLLQLSIKQCKGILPQLSEMPCQTLRFSLMADKISLLVVLE